MSWLTDNETSSCVLCHRPNLTSETMTDSDGNETVFCRGKEMEFWIQKDKHTIARQRIEPFVSQADLVRLANAQNAQIKTARKLAIQLGFPDVPDAVVAPVDFEKTWNGKSNELSRRICRNLWSDHVVLTTGEQGENVESLDSMGYEKFRNQCLNCHGGVIGADQPGFDAKLGPDTNYGIDCLRCHDTGNGTGAWLKKHSAPSDWRLESPELKEQAGLRDLISIRTQADMCYDCHIGNRGKGMFVTHRMYAAGHPPLPSIDVQTFSEKMPQHWQTPRELNASLKSADDKYRVRYFQLNYKTAVKDSPEKTFWNTRKMLIGALAARKKTVELYIDSAEPDKWGDYALYDCSGCHHELRRPSYRQKRSLARAPGRPRQSEWPYALLATARKVTNVAAMTAVEEEELVACFSRTPFGMMRDVSTSANDLATKIDEQIRVAESMPFDSDTAYVVLQSLVATPPDNYVTYDSARQLVWAIETVVDELEEVSPGRLTDDVVKQAKSLSNAKISGVSSDLPSGREKSIFPDFLTNNLIERANFDSSKLRSRLDELNKALSATH